MDAGDIGARKKGGSKDKKATPETRALDEVEVATQTSDKPGGTSIVPRRGSTAAFWMPLSRSPDEFEKRAQEMAEGIIAHNKCVLVIHEFMAVWVRAATIADEKMKAMGWTLQPAAPVRTIYCNAVIDGESKTLTFDEYQSLLGRITDYDLFIDGLRRIAGRKNGEKCESQDITTLELEMLAEYIESRKPLRPMNTRVGGRTSADAAQKIFDKARAKVDIRLGRYKWRAFTLHKNLDSAMKAFEFRPPNDFRYCLLLPR